MSDLPLCACGEFYQSHHPECPARRAFEEALSRLSACEKERDEWREHYEIQSAKQLRPALERAHAAESRLDSETLRADHEARLRRAAEAGAGMLGKDLEDEMRKNAELELKVAGAEKLCELYFTIAEEIVGEDEVRRRRDAAWPPKGITADDLGAYRADGLDGGRRSLAGLVVGEPGSRNSEPVVERQEPESTLRPILLRRQVGFDLFPKVVDALIQLLAPVLAVFAEASQLVPDGLEQPRHVV